jgi:phenylpropionate dioxygenase-like ring-hydroxylating dioxygenase large terminal subunit
MSEHGAEATRGVHWPSNGLSEVPFRVYTDPEQYRLEQERIFKGPCWSYLCLAAEIPNPAAPTAATSCASSGMVTATRSSASITAGPMTSPAS